MKNAATARGNAAQDSRIIVCLSWFGLLVAVAFGALSLSCSDTCTQSLSASRCPPTYEAIGDSVCSDCRDHMYPCPTIATCGSFLVFGASGGYTGYSCYYDVTTGKLVASRSVSDIQYFCDGSSFDIRSGVSVGSCEFPPSSTFGPYCASP